MAVERKQGPNFVTVIGEDVSVGQQAPEFISSAQNWAEVNPVTESKGKFASILMLANCSQH
ncbi:MAG: hypothetical protein GY755_02445 [Chloroflexi bacterium]|nr:hypothetical protein [Chloroflexota bacterium]